MMHDEERDHARHGVAEAREQAEQEVETEAQIGARHPELVVHHAGDEAHLGEPLLVGQSLAVVAPKLGGGRAAGAAISPGASENLLAAAHRLKNSHFR
jgi:hypothetical protein